MRIRPEPLLGFALILSAPAGARSAPDLASSGARPRPEPERPLAGSARPRPAPERPRPVSGAFEKPRPGDSRFPGEHPRPAGGLLGPLPPGLVLEEETLTLRCDAPGIGCEARHGFRLRNPGPARRVTLTVVTATLALHAEVEGVRQDWALAAPKAPEAPAPPPPPEREWRSGGRAVAPGRPAPFALPGRPRSRPVSRQRLEVDLPAGGSRTLTLVFHSVGGFDRTSRPRTQAEVAFLGTRRKDYFTYHHELRLGDPEARPHPGGGAGHVALEIDLPRTLDVGADVPLRCTRAGARQRCRGRLPASKDRVLLALAPEYHRPVGLFATVGAGVTARGAEAWLRVGVSLMLRRHLDLLTLTGETDAHHRFGLALVYQLFLPWRPNTHEMGGHGEIGLVLDAVPAVRPAIRLGGAFHFGFIRLNVLADIYPGEFKRGGGPAWRILLGAGLGI